MLKRLILFFILFSVSFRIIANPLQYNYRALDLYPDSGPANLYQETLKAGIYRPDYPPFDIVINGEYYDGINADIMRAIKNNSTINISINQYKSFADALAGLNNNKIDFIATSNPLTTINKNLYEFIPVITGNKIIEIINEDNVISDRVGPHIATVDRLLSDDFLKSQYPNARITRYSSVLNALASVALGTNDRYLGDAISAGYYYNNSIFNDLHVNRQLHSAENHEEMFYYMIRANDAKTKNIIESGIGRITQNDLSDYVRRWDKSSDFITPGSPAFLTENEIEWLKKRHTFDVLMPKHLTPFSDLEQDRFTGLTKDILDVISRMLNIKFKFIPEPSSFEERPEVDMIGFASSFYKNDTRYKFTRSYAQFPLVLITDAKYKSNAKNRSVTVSTSMNVDNLEGYNLEGYKLIHVASARDAYALLAQKKVTAVLDNYISANYMIHHENLPFKITSVLDGNFAKLSFGIAEHDDILYKIINKTIKNIAESEFDDITRKWTIPPDKVSFYEENKTAITLSIVLLSIILFAAVVWAYTLKKTISHSRKIQKKLDNQLALTKSLINGTPNPMYIRDCDAELISYNEAYINELRNFNLERNSVHNINSLTDNTLANKTIVTSYREDFFRILKNKRPITKDRVLKFSDGRSDAVIYHWMVPYLDADDNINGVIGGWIDITARIQMEEKLKEAKKLSERANAAKTTFLATMSHEIRTPLNAIIGMLELGTQKLHKGIIDSTAFDVAYSSSIMLQELIGNILDITMIESDKLVIHSEEMELKQAVDQIISLFTPSAFNKSIGLKLDFPSKLDNFIVTIDELRFRQVVSNIISNAIKFTTAGEVKVTVELISAQTADTHLLKIIIQDSGCGIPESEQRKLFKPFSQAELPADARQMGSGLGLAISRRLCEAMNGEIQLNSTPGVGTRVEVSFKVVAHERQTKAPEVKAYDPSSAEHQNTILIVDDFYPNILLLNKQLTYLGYKVIECSDSRNAFHIWEKSRAKIVFTDCNMPHVTGTELTKMIREISSDTIILGLTADARDEQKEICLMAGMNDCIFKPVSLEKLSLSLNRYLKACGSEKSTPYQNVNNGESIDPTIIYSCIEHLNVTISDLHDAIAIKSFIQISELAHLMKGGLYLIRQNSLADICTELEVAADQEKISECLRLALLLEDGVNEITSD